jgi:FAD/FMN-containing dehydrogenase
VRSLRLLRSDGSVRNCSPTENPDLFAATVGGLGLTGLILSARLALLRVPGFDLACEDIRYDGLDAFFRLSEESRDDWPYTVAWIDCLAPRASVGRGVFSRARHSDESQRSRAARDSRLAVPFDAPGFLLSRASVRTFNALRWRRFSPRPQVVVRPFDPVLYPLDGIGHWNRLYGRRGFYQYQCVVPNADAPARVAQLLRRVADSGQSAFLAVLKVFGDKPSPGMLSFPMPGATLALDLPHRGAPTLALMDELDAIVRDAGGRIYPAKDGRMSAEDFRGGFPRWREFARHADPAFSSSFWRRVSV